MLLLLCGFLLISWDKTVAVTAIFAVLPMRMCAVRDISREYAREMKAGFIYWMVFQNFLHTDEIILNFWAFFADSFDQLEGYQPFLISYYIHYGFYMLI